MSQSFCFDKKCSSFFFLNIYIFYVDTIAIGIDLSIISRVAAIIRIVDIIIILVIITKSKNPESR